MARVSIIGAGHVGTTLGLLFARHGHIIEDVVCRTRASAGKACAIIGNGRPLAGGETLTAADIYVIATNDDTLPAMAASLIAGNGAIWADRIVFHCSGATPSAALSPLRDAGAAIASVHPVKTFTDPRTDAESFSGTWCGVEGDAAALAVLRPMFESFGAQTFAIDGERKALYHAGIVFICNYLFSLIEVGERCYEAAGVPRATVRQIVQPILHATVDNALRLGPAQALTGPIARGDDATVERQLAALRALDPHIAQLYAGLGQVAADLSARKGAAPPDKIQRIRELLAS